MVRLNGDADGTIVGIDVGNFVLEGFAGDNDGDLVGTLDGKNVAGFFDGMIVSPPIETGALVRGGGRDGREEAVLNEGGEDGCTDGLVGGVVLRGLEGDADGASVVDLVGLVEGTLI